MYYVMSMIKNAIIIVINNCDNSIIIFLVKLRLITFIFRYFLNEKCSSFKI